jgi:GH35 family endo-1,4-beta-xylanase
MKKYFYLYIFAIFIIAAGTLKAQSSVLSYNFEGNTIGDSFAHIGWSQSDVQAVVAADPLASGNKVLKNKIHNYNAAPVLRYILPAGRTLADFSSFTFKGYFAKGDVGYKDIVVEAYQNMPTAQFTNNASAKIGSWSRAKMGSTAWENIVVNITNTSSFHDTIYIAFGINCAGTGNVGVAGDTTVWYADTVTIVPKPAANTTSVFAASTHSIDFGKDTVGIAKKSSVIINSKGTDTLRVTAISSTNAFFTFSPAVFVLAPSDSSNLTITFMPTDTSSQSGFIILTHNGTTSPDSIAVKGKGVQGNVIIPIVTNGGFESSDTGVVNNNVKGWVISVGSGIISPPVIQIVSNVVEEGKRALKVTVNAATSTQWDIQAIADSLRVKPNGKYNYSIWAKADNAGAQVNFTIGYFSTGEIAAIRPAILSTQWQKFTLSFTVTNNELYIRGPVHFSYAENIGNTIYIDNLQITEVIQNPVDTSKIWKGPALASGMPKFLGSAGDSPSNSFANYWTQITPENAGKWGSVGISTDTTQWRWSNLDNDYNYAINNHLLYKHHTLIWGNQQPSWISSMDTATQRYWIETWFKKVGERYPKMDMVDVVNEPLYGHNPPDGENGHANYINGLGGTGKTMWNWLIKSFELARQYLPHAKLLINDYGIINNDGNTTSYIQIIGLLKDRGLIDGIGEQGHGFEGVRASTIKSNLDRLAAIGLPIYITEFDLNIQDDIQQKAKYQELFPVLWQHSAVKGITLWGYLQGKTWVTNSYLVNTDGTARPALLWLADYIKNNPTGIELQTTGIPTVYQLSQNFPNPFNPATTIQYSISKISNVSLKVFDMLGREVQTLVNTQQAPGQYAVTLNAQNLGSGVYFYRLNAGSFTETKKLMLLK